MGTSGIRRFGPFHLDVAERRLARAAQELHLTPKAFDLLVFLVDAAPRVVPKDEIHQRIWPDTFVADATLIGLVKELRRTLDDRDASSPIIRTVHSVGYAFTWPVERVALTVRRPPLVSHWLDAAGTRLALHEGVNAIGRDPASDVWINAAGVSRQHARIVIDHDVAQIEDADSKNGTRLGSNQVVGAATLHDGDALRMGSAVVTYRSSGTGHSTETQRSKLPTDPVTGTDHTRR